MPIESIKRNLATIFSFIHLGFIQGFNVLIQLLLIPIITRIVGLSAFGFIMVAASYAALASIVINYGSNQSGVKDVTIQLNNRIGLSKTFYTIYLVRLSFFILSFIGLLLWGVLFSANIAYLLLANAIILSETINPLFFFIATQKLFLYNIVNLVSKIISVALIMLLIHTASDSAWVNFFLGMTGVIGNLGLCIFLIRKYKLTYTKIEWGAIMQYLKQNFFLTGNYVSIQLQQSFFLFALSKSHNPLVVGAYSLTDKIVSSFRLIIVAFYNAVYPKAVLKFQSNPQSWKIFKKKLNILLFISFSSIAAILYFFSDHLVIFITGTSDALASLYIKSVCVVPLIAALNALNVLDLIVINRYADIFFIGLILLAISVIASQVFLMRHKSEWFGYYFLIVEVFSIPLYLYFIKRGSKRNIDT